MHLCYSLRWVLAPSVDLFDALQGNSKNPLTAVMQTLTLAVIQTTAVAAAAVVTQIKPGLMALTLLMLTRLLLLW